MQTISHKKTRQTFQLPDGRTLGYAEYGDPYGKPFYYFHGWPSSRIEFAGLNDDEIAQQMHLRVIAVDRPGFELPSIQPRYKFTDWPVDVTRRAEYLSFERFDIVGVFSFQPIHPGLRPYAFGPADSYRRHQWSGTYRSFINIL